MTAQDITIVPKKTVGPTLLISTVIGGWQIMYGTKNIKTTIDWFGQL